MLLDGLNRLVNKISGQNASNMNKYTESMTALVLSFKDSPSKDEPSTPGSTTSKVTKLTKLIKVLTWSRNMSLETFKKQLQTWTDSNEEITEFLKYHELMESLKSNKDIKNLPRYVG